jgi:hypothetical protein
MNYLHLRQLEVQKMMQFRKQGKYYQLNTRNISDAKPLNDGKRKGNDDRYPTVPRCVINLDR